VITRSAATPSPSRRNTCEFGVALTTTSLWDEGLHDTAGRILDAAVALFADQGFRATTVKEITERCGITQAAMYLYFPSKDAVLAALINHAHAELTRRLDEADPKTGSNAPRQRLKALVGAMVEYGTECTVMARVADREWRALTEPQLSAVADLRRDVRSRFEKVVQACLDENLFPADAATVAKIGDYRARLLATAIIDMCLGVASWYDKTITISTDGLVSGYQSAVLAMAGMRPRARRS
jgi:AcrR family transcriptional regulator